MNRSSSFHRLTSDNENIVNVFKRAARKICAERALKVACIVFAFCFLACGVESIWSQESLRHQFAEKARTLQKHQEFVLVTQLAQSIRGAAASLLTVTKGGDTREQARLQNRIKTMIGGIEGTSIMAGSRTIRLNFAEADLVKSASDYEEHARKFSESPTEEGLASLINQEEQLRNESRPVLASLSKFSQIELERLMSESTRIQTIVSMAGHLLCCVILWPVVRAVRIAIKNEADDRLGLETKNSVMELANQDLIEKHTELDEQRQKLQEALDHAENQKAMHDHASRRFQSLFSGLPVGCMTFESSGMVMEWNAQMSKIFGVQPHQALLSQVTTTLQAAGREDQLLQAIQEVAIEGRQVEFEWDFEVEGLRRTVSMVWFPLKDPNGNAIGGIACAVDVTARKEAEAKVAVANERVKTTLESIRDNFFSADLEGRFTYVNHSAADLIGVESDDLVGKKVWDYCRGTDWNPIKQLFDDTVQGEMTSVGEFLFSELGTYFEFRTYPSQGGVSVFFQDVTDRTLFQRRLEDKNAELEEAKLQLEISESELKQANERLRSLASTDGLTGLNNHKSFQEYLQLQFESAEMFGTSLSVALMDVDKFKTYNDCYGHPAGDQVLKGVAEVLKSIVPKPHMVARYGGEEFVVILIGLDEVEALTLIEEIRYELEDREWPHREVTASFGVSFLSSETKNRQELIEQADQALYASKEGGRNRVTAWCWLSDERSCESEPEQKAS